MIRPSASRSSTRRGEQDGQFTFRLFDPRQVKAARDLALNILQRYPDITPTNVVEHADIAVGRKEQSRPDVSVAGSSSSWCGRVV